MSCLWLWYRKPVNEKPRIAKRPGLGPIHTLHNGPFVKRGGLQRLAVFKFEVGYSFAVESLHQALHDHQVLAEGVSWGK